MGILLGNLSVSEMQSRAGIEFPAELIEFMKSRHQDAAEKIQPGKWHCFDLPFVLVCGDMDTAKEIYRHLATLSASFKQKLQISIE